MKESFKTLNRNNFDDLRKEGVWSVEGDKDEVIGAEEEAIR